jgi:hypothetical protein
LDFAADCSAGAGAGVVVLVEEWARAISQSFQSVAGGSYLSAPTVDTDNDLDYGDYDD